MYFKIQGTYFKIYALYFSRKITLDFQRLIKGKFCGVLHTLWGMGKTKKEVRVFENQKLRKPNDFRSFVFDS